MFARYASVIPLSEAINFVNQKIYLRGKVIPRNHQLMLWWAGLRGAISFALSYDVTGEAGPAIRTTTLFVCVVSILVLGSTTNQALVKWNIRTGVGLEESVGSPVMGVRNEDSERTDSSEGDPEDWDDDLPGSHRKSLPFVRPFQDEGEDEESAASREESPARNALLLSRPTRGVDSNHWFIGFDNRYLKPIFTRARRKVQGLRIATGPSRRASGNRARYENPSTPDNYRLNESDLLDESMPGSSSILNKN